MLLFVLNIFVIHIIRQFSFKRGCIISLSEVIATVIYLDILVFLNAVIDYFLLLATSAMSGFKIKELRLVISSIIAALTSLYIFVPKQPVLLDIIFRACFLIVVTFATFGFKSLTSYVKSLACLILVTLLYNGLAAVVWLTFKPSSMIIKNSVVYFDISALEMVLFSVFGYLIIRVIQFLVNRFSPYAKRISIRIVNENAVIDTTALIDSGNSLTDIYSGKKVVVTDYNTAESIFKDLENKAPLYLPYKYVGGNGLIKCYYCDSVYVNGKNIKKALIAISENSFDGDYKAIVSPDILEG